GDVRTVGLGAERRARAAVRGAVDAETGAPAQAHAALRIGARRGRAQQRTDEREPEEAATAEVAAIVRIESSRHASLLPCQDTRDALLAFGATSTRDCRPLCQRQPNTAEPKRVGAPLDRYHARRNGPGSGFHRAGPASRRRAACVFGVHLWFI